MQIQPASSARTELTFRLSTPFPINPDDETVAFVPLGTEVATRQTEDEEEITFFKSVGNAVQDVSVARKVLEEAGRLGLGLEVEL